MKSVQYNPASDTVVLPSRLFRDLLERCGELSSQVVVPVEGVADYCDECGAVPQIDDGRHAPNCAGAK